MARLAKHLSGDFQTLPGLPKEHTFLLTVSEKQVLLLLFGPVLKTF